MAHIAALKKSILSECEEDHVGLWSVIRDVEDAYPNSGETVVRHKVLAILRDLFVAGRIRAGFPTASGRFRTIRGTCDQLLARIEADWPPGHRPTIGEGLWFTGVAKKKQLQPASERNGRVKTSSVDRIAPRRVARR